MGGILVIWLIFFLGKVAYGTAGQVFIPNWKRFKEKTYIKCKVLFKPLDTQIVHNPLVVFLLKNSGCDSGPNFIVLL